MGALPRVVGAMNYTRYHSQQTQLSHYMYTAWHTQVMILLTNESHELCHYAAVELRMATCTGMHMPVYVKAVS